MSDSYLPYIDIKIAYDTVSVSLCSEEHQSNLQSYSPVLKATSGEYGIPRYGLLHPWLGLLLLTRTPARGKDFVLQLFHLGYEKHLTGAGE